MKKLYFPLLICNTIFFSIDVITIWFSFFWIFKVVFSIYDFIIARNDKFNTTSGDLIIMIMSFISLLPIFGFFANVTGLVFCILNLVRYHKWNKSKEINRTIVNNDVL